MPTTIRAIPLLATLGLLLCGAALSAELVVPGSGNPEYVLGVMAQKFNQQQKEHHVSVPTSIGAAGAVRDLLAEKTDLARIGRPLTDAEQAKGLTYVPIGRDAVVFVAGAAVTVRTVSSAQMIDVFSGKTSDWRQLGAKAAPIRAVGREISETSRKAMARYIPAFQDMVYPDAVKLVLFDPQMIELLDRYDTSLGMLNRSALHANKTKVIALALDKVEPTPENLAAGRYPVWLSLGLIHRTRGTLSPAARAFMGFVKSAEGEKILSVHGILSPSAVPK